MVSFQWRSQYQYLHKMRRNWHNIMYANLFKSWILVSIQANKEVFQNLTCLVIIIIIHLNELVDSRLQTTWMVHTYTIEDVFYNIFHIYPDPKKRYLFLGHAVNYVFMDAIVQLWNSFLRLRFLNLRCKDIWWTQ